MQEYREIRKSCIYREKKLCAYWSEPTQCHFLSCPLFLSTVPKQEKTAIKKQISDSVRFNVNDLDNVKITVHDLIKEVQNNNSKPRKVITEVKGSVDFKQKFQRMKCVVCGVFITDDKFLMIRGSSNNLIYIHSKGKCEPRINGVSRTREEWLEKYLSKEEEP